MQTQDDDTFDPTGALALTFVEVAEARVCARWQERIVSRLVFKMEAELAKDGPPRPPTTEQQAMAIVKDIAMDLLQASIALEYAAKELKNITGKGNQAGKVYAAYQRAKRTAEEILA